MDCLSLLDFFHLMYNTCIIIARISFLVLILIFFYSVKFRLRV